MAGEILLVREVNKGFGGILALDRCSIAVDQGEIVGLIGPNGAGKSTLFDIISGFVQPDAGSIAFRGEEIVGLPAHRIARMGLVRTFQIPRALMRMTVLENMMLGAQGQTGERAIASIIRRHRVEDEESRIRKKGGRDPEILRSPAHERPVWRIAVRRPEEDAGDGQGPHGRSQAAAP